VSVPGQAIAPGVILFVVTVGKPLEECGNLRAAFRLHVPPRLRRGFGRRQVKDTVDEIHLYASVIFS
jgi:hypothetical protein